MRAVFEGFERKTLRLEGFCFDVGSEVKLRLGSLVPMYRNLTQGLLGGDRGCIALGYRFPRALACHGGEEGNRGVGICPIVTNHKCDVIKHQSFIV